MTLKEMTKSKTRISKPLTRMIELSDAVKADTLNRQFNNRLTA